MIDLLEKGITGNYYLTLLREKTGERRRQKLSKAVLSLQDNISAEKSYIVNKTTSDLGLELLKHSQPKLQPATISFSKRKKIERL